MHDPAQTRLIGTSRLRITWQGVALFAVGAVAVLNIVHLAGRIPPPLTADAPAEMRDYVTRSEPRFAPVRQAARALRLQGTIGYIEALRDTGSPQDAFQADYFIAQYALLPLLLDPEYARHEWTLANYLAPPPHAVPAGWKVARDFGDGVLLLQKHAP